MALIIYDDNKYLSNERAEMLKMTAQSILTRFNVQAAVELSIIDGAQMQALNKEMRGVDSVTDVLSFPALTFEIEGEITSTDPVLDYFESELYLGEIMICYEHALEQAVAYGHSQERELAFLTAHGMLHLLGFDHENADKEMKMFAIQREMLEEMGILR